MKLPLTWLREYLPKLPPTAELVETMMLHGLDVENAVAAGQQFDRVVVGEIIAIRPHPNADKLRLADVRISAHGEPQEIVCGAPNIEVGQKVPVALLGTKLPNGLTIEPRAIRGVTSNGMLCAEDELGLGQSHAGILVLDPKTKIGTPLAEVLGTSEAVLDVTTPANRADLMSMRGLAWEIGAMLEQKPTFTPTKLQESATLSSKSLTVGSADVNLCPLFTTRVIRGLSQPPTPKNIVDRLKAAEMRSINVIVDITNYIMLEYGQPLHAYDASSITGGVLTARLAKAGEKLVTLDGQQRSLAPAMLVIADHNGPIGLAGVMGGRATEVSKSTTDIVLEAAIFDPVSVRKTSRRLGLVSEASKRFEKGLWPEVTVAALNAAAAMIAEICGGAVEKGIVKAGKATARKRTVKLVPAAIADRLGMKIPLTKSKAVLQRLGFKVSGSATNWIVTVPTWRPDVSLPEDIIDEVGRMVGYDQVPVVMPSGAEGKNELPAPIQWKEEIRNVLVDLGFTEVISHAFYGEVNALLVKGNHFEIANPLDATQHKLRKSLLPQIDGVLKQQADAGRDAEVFEIGLIFDPDLTGPVDRQQRWKLALGTTHKGEAKLQAQSESLLAKLQTSVQPETFIVAREAVRGRIIEFCEFDLSELMAASKMVFGPWDPNRHIAKNVSFRQPSKYPTITRDISFWWPGEQPVLLELLADLQAKNPLLWETRTKDQFTKGGKTSYLISFIYQSPDRTLTKNEVDTVESAIKEALRKQGAEIR